MENSGQKRDLGAGCSRVEKEQAEHWASKMICQVGCYRVRQEWGCDLSKWKMELLLGQYEEQWGSVGVGWSTRADGDSGALGRLLRSSLPGPQDSLRLSFLSSLKPCLRNCWMQEWGHHTIKVCHTLHMLQQEAIINFFCHLLELLPFLYPNTSLSSIELLESLSFWPHQLAGFVLT